MINSKKIADALFPIENRLRILSKAGKGSCYVFAIYDICRTKADELKKLIDEQKRQVKEEETKQINTEDTRGDGPISKSIVHLFQL